MKSWQLLLTLIMGFSPLVNARCQALLMGGEVGALCYIAGELKSTEEVPLNGAWEATQEAINDLEFTIISQEKDAVNGQLIARSPAGKKIKVRLEKRSENTTGIRIRVGTFGDKSLSRQILETIKGRF